jgi:hypothetical protein
MAMPPCHTSRAVSMGDPAGNWFELSRTCDTSAMGRQKWKRNFSKPPDAVQAVFLETALLFG